MLTDGMTSLLRYLIFDLKIIQKCVENPYQKSVQVFLLPETILRPKSRSKIISKSFKIVLSTSKPHRAAPEVSKKAPEALKAATR